MSVQGRQRRVAGGRGRQVLVKLDEETYAVVAARAEQAGLSVPRWFAESAVRPVGEGAGWSLREARQWAWQLEKALTSLRRVGANLNQLAARANATGEFGAGLTGTLTKHEQTLDRLQRFVDHLERPGRGASSPDASAGPQ